MLSWPVFRIVACRQERYLHLRPSDTWRPWCIAEQGRGGGVPQAAGAAAEGAARAALGVAGQEARRAHGQPGVLRGAPGLSAWLRGLSVWLKRCWLRSTAACALCRAPGLSACMSTADRGTLSTVRRAAARSAASRADATSGTLGASPAEGGRRPGQGAPGVCALSVQC